MNGPIDEKELKELQDGRTTPSIVDEDVYEATLSPLRAAVRRWTLKAVERESPILARMQVRSVVPRAKKATDVPFPPSQLFLLTLKTRQTSLCTIGAHTITFPRLVLPVYLLTRHAHVLHDPPPDVLLLWQ